MAAHAKQPYTSPEAYLHWERKAETKHEYLDGIIVAMAGASKEHNVITFHLIRHIGNQIEGKDCEGYPSDMRVRVPDCNRYYYPDAAVVCGEPRFEDAERDTLLNPMLIIEVLSDSTERKDRGEKFDCCRTLESLQAYVLVAQQEPRLEALLREENGTWRYEVAACIDSVLTLEAIDCTLRLSETYARITFAPVAEESEERPR